MEKFLRKTGFWKSQQVIHFAKISLLAGISLFFHFLVFATRFLGNLWTKNNQKASNFELFWAKKFQVF